MGRQLRLIDPETDKRWDAFVLNHPNGSIYHHSLWGKVISATYGYQPFYIALENTTTHQFEGIFPMMLVKSSLTGKRMVSLPLTTYCKRLIPETELGHIIDFAMDHHPDLDYIELKFIEPLKNDPQILTENSLYTTHLLDLNAELDQLFKNFHSSTIRRRIKKAERYHLHFRLGDTEKDLRAFYRLETLVRKKHGLPPQPYSFFANIWRHLKPKGFMLLPLIEYNNRIIAANLMLTFKETFYYEYSASHSKFMGLGTNQKLVWETIKIAHKQGAKIFDFGRSAVSHTSLIEFKERWGAERVNLHYYYYPKDKKFDANKNNKLPVKLAHFTNRHLPAILLQLEGKLFYRHFG